MRQFEDQRSMLPYVCGLTLCLVVLSVCLGCGGTRASAVSASSSSVAPASSESDSLGSLLGEIARAVKPMPLYGWLRLPAGARVPDQWWPALDLSAPSEYRGGPVDNPWVTGADSTEPQMQYLLQIGGGWLMLFANFRGDLGDTQGHSVGNVAGHTATLYDVNGGQLVQWSDGGRWYGVFGRGVAEDVLVSIALEAQLIDPGNLQNGD
jgi:hypothetical protein